MTNDLRGRTGWIISDGKAGNVVQMRGVFDALGLDYIEKPVDPQGLHRLLAPWIGVARSEHFAEPGISAFAPPFPDFAISAGRLTVPYIRALKRLAGAQTFTIILQDPKVSLTTADLFCVPEHDTLRGPNVITTLTAPHGYSPSRLARLKEFLPVEIAALPKPRVAVMLGGSNGVYTYSLRALQRLACALIDLADLGAGLMITPSRRTEARIITCVRDAIAGRKAFVWDMQGQNPYPIFLAHADIFLVPADSINMTGEPCITGKPVYVFYPDGGSAKFMRFHRALERHGATRPWPDGPVQIDPWTYEPLDAAQRLAEAISQRWFAKSR